MQWPPQNITILGQTRGRPPLTKFGIKQQDRLSHIYITGKTGTGKSTLIENMVLQDAEHYHGLCLIDPHGDLAERIFANIPEHRKSDIVYLNVPEVPNVTKVLGYNPLRYVGEDKRSLAASGLLEVFKKMWSDSWGVRMEHILRNCILTLLEIRGSTLADIPMLLTDKDFRNDIVSRISNPMVKQFWQKEYARYSYPFRQTAIAPILNKVGAFLADPVTRKILTEPDIDISFRRIMDERKILLVNLSKGQIGEDASSLLGSLLVTTIGLAAYSRADQHHGERQPFHLYIDEFQSFSTLSVANMVSELRKFAVSITAASQTLTNIQPEIRDAMLGNCGTLISFRLGARDAPMIAKEFAPVFSETDMLSLPNHHINLKLMVGGAPSRPFGATTLNQISRQSPCGDHTQ